jgi:hypothetical protein
VLGNCQRSARGALLALVCTVAKNADYRIIIPRRPRCG